MHLLGVRRVVLQTQVEGLDASGARVGESEDGDVFRAAQAEERGGGVAAEGGTDAHGGRHRVLGGVHVGVDAGRADGGVLLVVHQGGGGEGPEARARRRRHAGGRRPGTVGISESCRGAVRNVAYDRRDRVRRDVSRAGDARACRSRAMWRRRVRVSRRASRAVRARDANARDATDGNEKNAGGGKQPSRDTSGRIRLGARIHRGIRNGNEKSQTEMGTRADQGADQYRNRIAFRGASRMIRRPRAEVRAAAVFRDDRPPPTRTRHSKHARVRAATTKREPARWLAQVPGYVSRVRAPSLPPPADASLARAVPPTRLPPRPDDGSIHRPRRPPRPERAYTPAPLRSAKGAHERRQYNHARKVTGEISLLPGRQHTLRPHHGRATQSPSEIRTMSKTHPALVVPVPVPVPRVPIHRLTFPPSPRSHVRVRAPPHAVRSAGRGTRILSSS